MESQNISLLAQSGVLIQVNEIEESCSAIRRASERNKEILQIIEKFLSLDRAMISSEEALEHRSCILDLVQEFELPLEIDFLNDRECSLRQDVVWCNLGLISIIKKLLSQFVCFKGMISASRLSSAYEMVIPFEQLRPLFKTGQYNSFIDLFLNYHSSDLFESVLIDHMLLALGATTNISIGENSYLKLRLVLVDERKSINS